MPLSEWAGLTWLERREQKRRHHFRWPKKKRAGATSNPPAPGSARTLLRRKKKGHGGRRFCPRARKEGIFVTNERRQTACRPRGLKKRKKKGEIGPYQKKVVPVHEPISKKTPQTGQLDRAREREEKERKKKKKKRPVALEKKKEGRPFASPT